MSMNLRCHEIEVWQTPTWLRKIALYDAYSDIRDPVETTHIYMAWVKSHLDGVWYYTKEDNDRKQAILDHINEIKDAHITAWWER